MSQAEQLAAMLERHALASNDGYLRGPALNAVSHIRATDAENQRLRAEVEALREAVEHLADQRDAARVALTRKAFR